MPPGHFPTPRTAYGAGARALHWATVLVLGAQLVLGYLMDPDDGGRGRGRGRGGSSGRGRGRGGDSGYDVSDDLLLGVHVGLGALLVLLGVARLLSRRYAGLPPWAEQLTAAERRLATWTERVLIACLFVVPLTGGVLLLGGDDDLVPLHVGSHAVLYAALAAHVALVLRRRLLRRML